MNKEQIDIIFKALGQAATCWHHLPDDMQFNSKKARRIGDKLIKDLMKADTTIIAGQAEHMTDGFFVKNFRKQSCLQKIENMGLKNATFDIILRLKTC